MSFLKVQMYLLIEKRKTYDYETRKCNRIWFRTQKKT